MRLSVSSSGLICLLTVVAIIFCGCVRSPAPRFYALTSTQEGGDVSSKYQPAKNAVIGIGPVKVADYLDQSQIVTRTTNNQVVKAEFDRWVGPFKDNFINVLADDVGFVLPTERIFIYPWRNSTSIDYQVTVDVIRCDGRLGDAASLETRWSIFKWPEKKVIKTSRSNITEPVTGADYTDLVAAQSRAMAKFSQEIAAAIQGAEKK